MSRYRIRLDTPGSTVLTIRIFPHLTLTSKSAPAPTPTDGQPLGAGVVQKRDLEWVDGGLIVREAAGESGPGQGWFCRVERWWWEKRQVGSEEGGVGNGTIPEWVVKGSAPASVDGDAPAEGTPAGADVSMEGL